MGKKNHNKPSISYVVIKLVGLGLAKYMTWEMCGCFIKKCVIEMVLMFHTDMSVGELHFMMILRKF